MVKFILMSGKVPAPELASPEYWGGVDIDQMKNFMFAERRFAGTLPGRTHRAAAFVLGTSLEDVAQGDFSERDPTDDYGLFDPRFAGIPDGSLVLVDQEALSKLNFDEPQDFDRITEPSRVSDLPDDPKELIKLWREEQDEISSGPLSPGTERIRVQNTSFDAKYYDRTVEWGVVVSQGGRKFVIKWPFSDLKVEDGLVSVLDTRDGLPAKLAPLKVGKVHPIKPGRQNFGAYREIERIRAVHLVEPQNAMDYVEAYRNAGRIRGIMHRLLPGVGLQI